MIITLDLISLDPKKIANDTYNSLMLHIIDCNNNGIFDAQFIIDFIQKYNYGKNNDGYIISIGILANYYYFNIKDNNINIMDIDIIEQPILDKIKINIMYSFSKIIYNDIIKQLDINEKDEYIIIKDFEENFENFKEKYNLS